MCEVPHVLTALLRAQAEARITDSDANIRSAVSPAWIKRILKGGGLEPVKEELVTPPEGLLDAKWEVGDLLREEFREEIRGRFGGDERGWEAWENGRDAVGSAVEKGGGLERVRSMVVWVAEF
jgi:hypothetical protein